MIRRANVLLAGLEALILFGCALHGNIDTDGCCSQGHRMGAKANVSRNDRGDRRLTFHYVGRRIPENNLRSRMVCRGMAVAATDLTEAFVGIPLDFAS
jgi:hypothetical protein